MKAIQFRRYGPSTVLEYVEGRQPFPAKGQYLVKVHAASVNPVDWKIRRGQLRMVRPLRFPAIPGFDICGEVVAAGGLATRFKLGDWIYAMLDSWSGGAYAEYAVVGEAAAALKPAALMPQEAAAIPLAALTALQALRDKGRLDAGQRVLIIGASGGVGHFAVQIAKATGAEVAAVCSSANVAMVRRLGADRVIDYQQQDYRKDKASYDIVFDAVAAGSSLAGAKLLAARGVYIATLPSLGLGLASVVLPLVSNRRARLVNVRPSGDDLAYLSELVAEGKLRPVIDRVYPLAEARAAHDYSEQGHARGKIVLQIVPSL